MMFNMFSGSEGIPIPILPPTHLHWDWLKGIVTLMDQYRDIRLVWTAVEALLMVVILVLIVYFMYRVKQLQGSLKERYSSLNERLRKIQELHRIADELEKNGDL